MKIEKECPICGSRVTRIKYRGNEPELLALMNLVGFCCFVGCVRVDLHDKVIDGVSYRGRVSVRPVLVGDDCSVCED